MRKEFEYIIINEVEKKPKTSVYQVLNKKHGDLLGIVRWHGAWRGYVLEIQEKTIWSIGCMKDVTGFMLGLMIGRKLVKHENALLCMNCHELSVITKEQAQLFVMSQERVCNKCNSKDVRLYRSGKLAFPKE